MGLIARAAVLLAALTAIAACAGFGPPARSFDVPADVTFDALAVWAAAGAGELRIDLRSGAAEPITLRVRVPPLTVGTREMTRREVAGYQDKVVCDGARCWIERVAVYRDETVEEPIMAAITVSPRSLTVAPAGRATVRVRLHNAAEATAPFVLSVLIESNANGRRTSLDLRCRSELLLDGPRGKGGQ